MLLNIKTKYGISSRTYNFACPESRSYVIDEVNHYEYMFEGYASDIWNIILTTKDYEKVYQYALQKQLTNELSEFLSELKTADLITFEGEELSTDLNKQLSTSFSDNWEDEDKFEEEQYKWLIKNNFLQNFSLQLSYKCNLSCRHCFNDKTQNDKELTLEQAKNIIDEAYNLGIAAIGVTGGECTYHKNFLEIARYIRDKHISLRFLTNGQLLYDDNFFDEVVSLYPNIIKISLYSMNPEIHDNLTQCKGSHKKTIHVIKKLREKNIPVNISFLAMTENAQEYKKIIQFGDLIGVGVSVSSHFINNPQNNNSSLELKTQDLLKLYRNKDFPHSPINSGYSDIERKQEICHAGYRTLAVAPNLDITPCNDFHYVLGNLNKTSLSYIWTKIIPEFREKFIWKNIEECLNYDYCKYCHYCPTPGFLEKGKLTKSRTCCNNAIAYNETLKERIKV